MNGLVTLLTNVHGDEFHETAQIPLLCTGRIESGEPIATAQRQRCIYARMHFLRMKKKKQKKKKHVFAGPDCNHFKIDALY